MKKIILLCLSLLLAACEQQAKQTIIAECESLQTKFSEQFNTRMQYQVAADSNHCIFTATGTGDKLETKQLKHFSDYKEQVEKVLKQAKWQDAKNANLYSADGVYSTRFALEKSNLLATVDLDVTASEANCPEGQPSDIYKNCGLTPEQRLYQAKIRVSAN